MVECQPCKKSRIRIRKAAFQKKMIQDPGEAFVCVHAFVMLAFNDAMQLCICLGVDACMFHRHRLAFKSLFCTRVFMMTCTASVRAYAHMRLHPKHLKADDFARKP
jgi:hypothetical protein